MNLFSVRRGALYCEDVAVEGLARKHGTPLYVYSKRTFASHFTQLDRALEGVSHLICYAVKANSTLAVIRTFADLGSGFDIVSGGELHRVIAAGGDPGKVVFAGVGKTETEIAFALRSGILFFSVESAPELERISAVAGRLKKTARFSVRVNPHVDAETHKHITTGMHASKFGLEFPAALALYRRARTMRHVEAVGVQMHIGSQITTARPYQRALDRLLGFVQEMRRIGIRPQYVDMGGGMGIIYRDETPLTPVAFAAAVLPRLRRFGTTVVIEPGRFVVGSGGILVTQVQYVKKTSTKTFVIVDAAMNDLIRPVLYGAYHGIVPTVRRAGRGMTADVVGPVCESSDFFAEARALPAVQPGDHLALLSAGAYGFSMASNYNSRPRAAEVMVDGRTARLIRRRETFEDLTRLEK